MRAFDYIITLFAFVYALATAHLLFDIFAWWIGMWDMRGLPSWSTAMIGLLFVMAILIYLQVRLTCPNIPAEGRSTFPTSIAATVANISPRSLSWRS
jgi:hypothetical protein